MSNYRKTMADALREMYPLDEETQLDEATMSSSQIARLKKAYEPMRDKKISPSNADKLSAMMDKVGKDKETLIQLFKADIPFVSQSAVTKLITKHNMKGAEINKLREEVDLDEGTKQVLAHGGKGKYKVTKDGDKIEIKFGGKVVGTADFDRGADSFFVSIKGEKGQKSFDDAQAIADYFAKNKITEEVDLDEGKMSQLHQYMQDKKSPEEIAKLMKLDVKTIKALMSSHHPEDVDEASAYADARRSMSKDKDFSRRDTADDDTGATDDDVRGASKNIIMQLRKAGNRASQGVEFGDGKKVQIPAQMAIAVQQKYNAMKRPADKEKFQARIGKSYKDMLSALKEELQPKKESILERMNRKIKENKHG
jgi:hypothetical protein